MLVVANDYIWEEVYKQRHLIIISFCSFKWRRQPKYKANHFICDAEKMSLKL